MSSVRALWITQPQVTVLLPAQHITLFQMELLDSFLFVQHTATPDAQQAFILPDISLTY